MAAPHFQSEVGGQGTRLYGNLQPRQRSALRKHLRAAIITPVNEKALHKFGRVSAICLVPEEVGGGAAGKTLVPPGLEVGVWRGAQAVRAQMQAQLDPEDLRQFAIQGAEGDFEEALGGRVPSSGILNVKSSGKSAGNHPRAGGGAHNPCCTTAPPSLPTRHHRVLFKMRSRLLSALERQLLCEMDEVCTLVNGSQESCARQVCC